MGARKKRTIIDEELPANGTGTNDGTEVDVADIIVVYSKVYKINAGTKSFCTQSQEPVDELFLQNNYPAGGKYVVYEYNTMNQLVNTANYDIEPKPISSINGNHSSMGGTSVQDIQVRMLFDELAFTRQLLMQQLAAGNNNKGGNIADLVGALASLHQITGGAAGKDPVELLIKGMELGQNGGKVSSDWKTELLGTLKEVAPAAIQALTAPKPQNGNGQPMALNPPSTQEILKENVQWIKTQILTGMNVDLAVGWLIQNVRNPDLQPMLSLAIQGTIDNFIAIDSEIANEPYRSWFTNAIAQIKEWYAEQQQVQTDDDMDGRDGNGTDVSHDAKSSVGSAKLTKVV